MIKERINPHEIRVLPDGTLLVDFDKIYSGYFSIKVKSSRNICAEIEVKETNANNSIEDKLDSKYFVKSNDKYHIKSNGSFEYCSTLIGSIGLLLLKGIDAAELCEVFVVFSHYPIKLEGNFECSDKTLNKIYQVGKHTVNICRQSIELDSPNHQENLGCIGDYIIESLVSYYCFGDTTLSRFDIIRIAEYMRMNGGKMFHTSYSLMWIYMLYDYYMFSGDREIFATVRDVIDMLLDRFATYLGDNGVIENPPNYMFIDWVPVDRYNLHHPPKALGQAAMTAFYYHALELAQKIYLNIGDIASAEQCSLQARLVKLAFHKNFYDKKKQIYCCGLNTESEVNEWLPQNADNKYFSVHVNTLAALYGLSDDGKRIMQIVMENNNLIKAQPYFMHFVLEALYQCGLFEKYGIKTIKRWQKQVEECDKGMKEAWGDFLGYNYDYSHGWATTPSYQLPSKILGLKILEPGFKKISLNPNLFGLDFANISVPTPFGCIKCNIGKTNLYQIPDEIEVVGL